MKVREIIVNESALGKALKYALPHIGKAASTMGKTTQALPKGKVAQGRLAAQQMGKRPKDFNFADKIEWMLKRRKIKIDRFKADMEAKRRQANIFAGWGGTALSAAGIGYAVYDYFVSSSLLDQDPNMTPEQKEAKLTELRASLFGTIVFPKLVGWVAKATVGNAVNLVSWMLGKMGMTGVAVGGALKIVKDVAIKGGVGALTAWMATDKGKDFFKNLVDGALFEYAGAAANLIAMVGKVAGAAVATAKDVATGDLNFDTPAKGDPYAGTWRAGNIK